MKQQSQTEEEGLSHHVSRCFFSGDQCGAIAEDVSLRSCITAQCYSVRVQIPALLLPTYVTLSKQHSLSGPQFLYHKSGNNEHVHYLPALLKCMYGKCSEECLMYSSHTVHGDVVISQVCRPIW